MLFLTGVLLAQDYDLPEELAEQLFDQVSQSEADPADQDFWENLPVLNVNKATFEDFQNYRWLSVHQIQNLLTYIDRNGPLVSIYELQAVPGWDLATIRMTQPLLKISSNQANKDGRSLREQLVFDGGLEAFIRTRRRLQLSKGYKNRQFLGGPLYWLGGIRYRRKGTIDLGLRIEKDAGESFIWSPKNGWYGTDHFSMFLMLENKGPFKKIILGDFNAQWDQGLILGRGLSFRKQVVTAPRKIHTGLMPHTGTREYGFQQGVGIEVQLGGVVASAFYSHRMLDAQIHPEDAGLNLPVRVSSIVETGLRRSNSELEKRKALASRTAGVHLKKAWGNHLVTTLSGIHQTFGSPLIPVPRRYNSNYFSGSSNLNLSGGFEFLWKNINIYSQLAVSSSRGWAALTGLTASLSHNFSISLHWRNYHERFHPISGKAFGMQTRNSNERGIYWAFQYNPSKKWVAGFYTNIFQTIDASFSSDSGYNGIDQLLRVQYIPTKLALLDFYWRGTRKPLNLRRASKSTHDLTQSVKHSFGLRGTWQGNSNLAFQCRIQFSTYLLDKTTTGKIISNQVSYDRDIYRITANLSYFDTDDFENRQYIYERDLPHGLSIPFFHGIGTRWYALVQLKPLKNISIWAKFAQSTYFNRDRLGTGVDEINGPRRSDISFQLRYRW